jgi:hypothetical protein
MGRWEGDMQRQGRSIYRSAERLSQADGLGSGVAGRNFVAGNIASFPGGMAARKSARWSSEPATAVRSIVEISAMPADVISSMTSIGSARKTGPVGCALQSWNARCIRIGIWFAC